MIVFSIICFSLLAGTYSQGQEPPIGKPFTKLVKSPGFQAYLVANGFKPLPQSEIDETLDEAKKPQPFGIVKDLEKRLNDSRYQMYQTIASDLRTGFENFKTSVKNWATEFGEFFVQQLINRKDKILEEIDTAANTKYTDFVTELVKATNTAVENYKVEAEKISKKFNQSPRKSDEKTNVDKTIKSDNSETFNQNQLLNDNDKDLFEKLANPISLPKL